MDFNTLYNILIEKKKRDIDHDDSVISNLLPYVNDDNVYLHFSELNKIGNNPKSTYKTPQGIYLYPLKIYWDKFLKMYPAFNIEYFKDIGHKINGNGDVVFNKFTDVIPFKTNAKYILVGTINNGSNILDFAKDIDSKRYKAMKKTLMDFFELTLENKKALLKLISTFEKESYSDSNLGMLWNLTRNMSSYQIEDLLSTPSTKLNVFFEKKQMLRWSYLMYNVLGIDGFVDSGGEGIIHPSEPIQAVVFSAKNIKHIDTILNKESYDFKSEMKASKREKEDILVKNIRQNPKLRKNLTDDQIIALNNRGGLDFSIDIDPSRLNDKIILGCLSGDAIKLNLFSKLMEDNIVDYIKKHVDIVPKILKLNYYYGLYIPNEVFEDIGDDDVLRNMMKNVPHLIPEMLSRFNWNLPFNVFKTAIDEMFFVRKSLLISVDDSDGGKRMVEKKEVVGDIVRRANSDNKRLPDNIFYYLINVLFDLCGDITTVVEDVLLRQLEILSLNSVLYVLKNCKPNNILKWMDIITDVSSKLSNDDMHKALITIGGLRKIVKYLGRGYGGVERVDKDMMSNAGLTQDEMEKLTVLKKI